MIVDDHPIFRHGLVRLLKEQPEFVVCGEASDAAEAIRLAKSSRPDLAVVDISLPDTNGIELTKRLHHEHPKLQVLIVSMHKDTLYAERAMRAGARGYVIKQQAPDQLLAALRTVESGKTVFQISTMTPLTAASEKSSLLSLLSDRELQVFQMIGAGRSTRQIAQDLGLSVKTVESYRAHIKDKMGLESGYALVQSAIYWHHFESRPG